MNELFREYLSTIILSIVVITLIIFVISPVRVSGTSMEPTLTHKQYAYQLKLAGIERFDIVTFKAQDQRIFIKRVIGLPGDSIVYEDGKLSVNEQDCNENYLLEEFTENYAFTVPDAYYFVLGDNRNNSTDSRQLGFIPQDKLVGVVHTIF